MINNEDLTERQLREMEYHKEHADLNKEILERPFSFDVIFNKKRR